MTLPSLTLILGGAASGKSAFGEQIVNNSGRGKVYIATSRVFDAEMETKIADHVSMRGAGWQTIEAPLKIGTALEECGPEDVAFVDCATMWLTNVMMDELSVDAEIDRLLATLEDAPCPVIVVSNEVGHGIVPDNKLARSFREAQGKLNQRLASQAGTVVMVTAGLPFALKGGLPA